MGLSEIIFHDSANLCIFMLFFFGFSFADRNLGKMEK